MGKPISSDVAFTPSVKAVQLARGSRRAYARIEQNGGFQTAITAGLVDFLEGIDTAYLATANLLGQPYAQHRGGPKGFIRVVDAETVGFADYVGNKQYVTTGNLADNEKAFLFMMDYAEQRRIKLWGRARVVEGDAKLAARLMPEGYRARAEQVILFTVDAWDANCPQHIPVKIDIAEVSTMLGARDAELAALRADNHRLRVELASKDY